MATVNYVCSQLLWCRQYLDDAVWLAAVAVCGARRLRCVPQCLVDDDQACHLPSCGGRVPRSFRIDLVASGGSNLGSRMAERGNPGADLRSHGDFLGSLAGADPFRKVAGWRARSDVSSFDEHTLGSRGADYAERISRLLDGRPGSLKKPAKRAVTADRNAGTFAGGTGRIDLARVPSQRETSCKSIVLKGTKQC